MDIENLTVDSLDDMSDEEITLWFGVLKQQEQIKQMKKMLKDYLEVRDMSDTPRTIKIDSRIVN